MGFLTLDHRACDPAIQREYGGLKEFDTKHCQHCEAVLVKIPGKPMTWACAMPVGNSVRGVRSGCRRRSAASRGVCIFVGGSRPRVNARRSFTRLVSSREACHANL